MIWLLQPSNSDEESQSVRKEDVTSSSSKQIQSSTSKKQEDERTNSLNQVVQQDVSLTSNVRKRYQTSKYQIDTIYESSSENVLEETLVQSKVEQKLNLEETLTEEGLQTDAIEEFALKRHENQFQKQDSASVSTDSTTKKQSGSQNSLLGTNNILF